jgi:hypothetical protein
VNWFQKDEKKHDTEFALSTGNVADVNVIGTAAAEVMAVENSLPKAAKTGIVFDRTQHVRKS